MASKTELAQRYMALQRGQNFDELLEMMADDVTMSNPMTGTTNGKEALAEQMRKRPMPGGSDRRSPMGNVKWSEPEEEDGDVKILGTGSAFGTLKILLAFNDDSKIVRIDAGLA